MRALVFGAGRMGQAAGHDLENHGVEVIYADVSAAALDKVADKAGTILLGKEQNLTELVKFFDVVLGTSGYAQNVDLTSAAIDGKTHFCDLGGNVDVVQQQLSLDQEARDAGIICIPDCGLAPGMANLLAAKAIENVGGVADKVTIRVGGLPQNTEPPFNYEVTWSPEGLLTEYENPCAILGMRGEELFVDPLEDLERLVIDGTVYEAFNTSGGLSTLASTYVDVVQDMNYKTIRYPGHCVLFKALKKLGLFEEPHRKRLKDRLVENLTGDGLDKVLVQVFARNKEKCYTYTVKDYYDENTGHSAMARTTGYSIAAVAYLLASGEAKAYTNHGGVLPGEVCLPLDKYISMMRSRGISIEEYDYDARE